MDYSNNGSNNYSNNYSKEMFSNNFLSILPNDLYKYAN